MDLTYGPVNSSQNPVDIVAAGHARQIVIINYHYAN
jgi:hypothetical protein